MKTILVFLFILFLSTNAISAVREKNISDNKYLLFGAKYRCVGRLQGKYKNGDFFSGSAVAISKRHILTAAHVVHEYEYCVFQTENGSTVIYKILTKNFNYKKFGVADIAIGYADKDIIIESYPELYNECNEINKECCIIGFGSTGVFDSSLREFDDKKRGGTNKIDSIQDDLLICSPSKPPNATSLEFLISTGDSGGALFIDGKLAGINSCVIATDGKPDSSYGDESGHTRISNYIEWISENTNEEK